ncbi:hypothetical protein HY418_01155, partial [Candidatus Kaiserbacteria bacterium]|nr:hypothetical protein [Candidatus Kaiserbacteria bacterium]
MQFWKRSLGVHEIAPEDIFIDSSNLPRRDEPQFEGRVVRPLGNHAIAGVGLALGLVLLIFAARLFDLSILNGTVYAEISRENHLTRSLVFAPRGEVYDRTGRKLAWNIAQASSSESFALREYVPLPGLSHVLGYVSYPKADTSGVWWRTDISGVAGIERAFDTELAGQNGSTMIETDAQGGEQQQVLVEKPQNGKDVILSIDADVQSELYSYLSTQASAQRFVGGA